MRRYVGKVSVFQPCRGKEKVQLPTAPKGIEIACNDDLLVSILGKGMQLFELVLSVSVFQ